MRNEGGIEGGNEGMKKGWNEGGEVTMGRNEEEEGRNEGRE